MYTLYTLSGSCSTAIHALLNKLDQTVEIIHFSDVENYHLLVPTRQVPALQDGEKRLTEGGAIVLYLLKKHNIPISTWGDEDEFHYWLLFCYATLHPAYGKLFSGLKFMQDGEVKDKYYQALAKQLSELWKIVDTKLESSDFILGDKVSVIDYLVTIYASWGNVFPELEIKLGSNVKNLAQKVSNLPEFQQAYMKEGAEHSLPKNS
ncbi:glutathione S-transferase family protein [Catenovulum maritimum]|uniref:Glutathione S-transferase n=1 Tax=Catenovulum maritimum TaxID=1513271 RepID=A0A0J8GZS2_9ALTE|nr:glutathione S-transferase family protein [Catenovulum maritimum]KMT66734.1 hypothetical protein XM47_01000 [Catenovulum maritimum]